MMNKLDQTEKNKMESGIYAVPDRLKQVEALVITRFMDKLIMENNRLGRSKYLGYEYFA